MLGSHDNKPSGLHSLLNPLQTKPTFLLLLGIYTGGYGAPRTPSLAGS